MEIADPSMIKDARTTRTAQGSLFMTLLDFRLERFIIYNNINVF